MLPPRPRRHKLTMNVLALQSFMERAFPVHFSLAEILVLDGIGGPDGAGWRAGWRRMAVGMAPAPADLHRPPVLGSLLGCTVHPRVNLVLGPRGGFSLKYTQCYTRHYTLRTLFISVLIR